jgi:AAA15 family ATPase/GTPase
MVKLKKIHLINFCGYRDTTFDFTDKNGDIKPMSVFYGMNGNGKTSVLKAIHLLSVAKRFQEMKPDLLFRKLVYHPDYCSGLEYREAKGFSRDIDKHQMRVEGTFLTNDGDKEVILDNKGVVLNELPDIGIEYANFIDPDSPMNLNKFQIHSNKRDLFLDMAKEIYGFDCELDNLLNSFGDEVSLDGGKVDTKELFYTDFIIHKFGTKVHFRSMSGGEKKLAILLKSLCDNEEMNNIDIILIDNLEKEIYMKRHPLVVKKLLEKFPDKQFIVTTHSPIIVGWNGVPGCVPKEWLFNVDEYKETENGTKKG